MKVRLREGDGFPQSYSKLSVEPRIEPRTAGSQLPSATLKSAFVGGWRALSRAGLECLPVIGDL